MVKIRLQRAGAKKRPFYRVVAIDERRQRDGRALEFLGVYDPTSSPERVEIDTGKVDAWMERGARLTDTVRSLVKRARQQPPPAEEAAAAKPLEEAAAPEPAAAEGGAS